MGDRRIQVRRGLAAHDDRDAAVARIEGVLLEMQLRVGVPAHGAELPGMQPFAFHDATRRVGAVGRQLPVAVSLTAAVLTAVRVALDDDVVGELAELVADHRENALALAAQGRAAAVEEARAGSLHKLDAEALGGDAEFDLIAQRLEVAHFQQLLPDVIGRRGEQLMFLRQRRGIGSAGLRSRDRVHTGPPAGQDAFRLLIVEHARIAEVARDRRLDVLALRDEPHHEEERHHRGHEVGVRDFPGAAMVSAVPLFLLPDDDDGRVAGLHAAFGAAAACVARQARSVSSNVGRTSLGSVRRANSTAIAGGRPLNTASTPALMHCSYRPSSRTRASRLDASGWTNPYDIRMPRNVPTSAAPTLWPISAGGPSIACIVMTTPRTAATMPRPGSASP